MNLRRSETRPPGLLAMVAGILGLAGCMPYPLGMSREQWESLPAEKQAEYSAQQARIDEAHAAQAVAIARERARLERERLRAAYAEAHYGDIITVSIHDGMVAFFGKRHPYLPVTFDLVRGETKIVEFIRQGRPQERTEIAMRFSEDGRWFIFDEPAAKRIKLQNDGWERGRSYTPPAIGAREGLSEAIDIRIDVRLKRLPAQTRSRYEQDPPRLRFP